jgi:hypothetical protein
MLRASHIPLSVSNGGEAGTNCRGPAVRKGGPAMLHNFCLSRLYRYLSIVQINSVRQRPIYSATEIQSFLFSVKIFSWSALGGGRG